MAVPIPSVPPESAVKIAQTLIRAFAGVLHARRTSRLSFFEGMVEKQYKKLGEVHRAFHDLLLPLDQCLDVIERDLIRSDDAVWTHLGKLSKIVTELNGARHKGQPDRHELVAHCQVVASSIVLPAGRGRALSQGERQQVRSLMAAICAYFVSNEEYQHDFGNVVSALESTISAWLDGDLELTINSVREYRAALRRTIESMSRKWLLASRFFAAIRANLEFEVQLGALITPSLREAESNQISSAA